MTNITPKCAVELNWCAVCDIASQEIEAILGLHIPCKADVTRTEFWALAFEGCRLPLPKLCQLLQAMQATPEDWEDALPDEGETDVGALDMTLAEKLIGRHLKLRWKYHLITADSLWLVGVEQEHGTGCALANDLVQAVADIADYLHRQEDKERTANDRFRRK